MRKSNLLDRFLWRTVHYFIGIVLGVGGLGYGVSWPVAQWFAIWLFIGWLGFHIYHIAVLLNRSTKRFRYPWQGYGIWREILILLTRQLRQQRRHQWQCDRVLKRFIDASDLVPDGLIVLDQAYHVEWFNAAAAEQFDFQHALSEHLDIRVLIRQPAFHLYLTQKVYQVPLTLSMAYPHHTKRTLSLRIIPFERASYLLLSRDITELEHAQTMRRDFVANISHELCTPLTVIGGFLETFSTMKFLDKKLFKQYLPVMLAQSERMKTLLQDLLMLSRLENQALPTYPEKIAMPPLLALLQAEANSLSQGKHKILVENSGPYWLMGQSDELRSAFSNLITNAIRYTPAGGSILLAWHTQDHRPTFTVEDTGIGIAPELIPRLTERFYRVDQGRSRETGGTGLGLSIVYHTALRHQAKLIIDSEPEKGSRFSLRFPRISQTEKTAKQTT